MKGAVTWLTRLRLPVIVAPMFRVSGPELVIAACRSGVVGAFPHQNCRTSEELEQWLERITSALSRYPDAAPFAVNLIMRHERLEDDLELVVHYRVPLVITSVGSPAKAIAAVHSYGGVLLADVATLRHAKKAVSLGVDGLILLCAGSGGKTGWVNPFAFVRAVREFYDGLVVLAGSISDGISIRAAQVLGSDLVYMGTRFIATEESMAVPEYKEMVLAATMDDIVTTRAFTGLMTNFLRPSIVAAGFDPERLPEYETFEQSEHRKKRWRDIWSAGQGVGASKQIVPVCRLVQQLCEEYEGTNCSSL